MANYYKSFNFKNGIQIDNDNFIVNANGLVGIGTTVPTELLDVRGNTKIVGILTATSVQSQNFYVSGVSTHNNLNVGNISINSGIITAKTGIVTYYGDGSKLSNIAGSYWSSASNGIYSTNNVGIATTNPEYNLQIGPNPFESLEGIVFDNYGNVYSNGIITATSFSGSGNSLINLNASNISSGTLNNSRLPSNVNLSGIVTAKSFVGSGAGVTSLNASNIISGSLSNSRLPSNISVSGIVTASSFVGNLSGTATTASNLVSTGSISVNSAIAGVASVGILTVSNTLRLVGFPAKIGIGTTADPQSDIEVRKTGISSIRVISENNIALIGIGRSSEIRTGNTDTYYSYSTPNSLDILNHSPGNVNFYLDYGSAGVGTGTFHWIHGQIPFNPLMSLTYNGNLGLGITNPSSKLYVNGTGYFSGNVNIEGQVNILNNLNVTGSISGRFSKIIEKQNVSTFSNNILNINASQGNVFTHTTAGNIGIVSFAGISTSNSNTQTFTVLIKQGTIPYNTSTITGIGTQLATIVTENGVGYSTHIKVTNGVPITLTNAANSLDLVTFIVSYDGNTPITNNSFTIVGFAATNFRGA
jgi:hypothetical protein